MGKDRIIKIQKYQQLKAVIQQCGKDESLILDDLKLALLRHRRRRGGEKQEINQAEELSRKEYSYQNMDHIRSQFCQNSLTVTIKP